MKSSTKYYATTSGFILDRIETGCYKITLQKDNSLEFVNIKRDIIDFYLTAYFDTDRLLSWINHSTLFDAYVLQFKNEELVRYWDILSFIRRCKIEKL